MSIGPDSRSARFERFADADGCSGESDRIDGSIGSFIGKDRIRVSEARRLVRYRGHSFIAFGDECRLGPGQPSRMAREGEAEPGLGSPGLDVDRDSGEHQSEKNRHTYLPNWHLVGCG